MPETQEEKEQRWARAAALSYQTPAMLHALSMSKAQSQNKYKEKFDKTKGKGYTSVASTPLLENAKKQSSLVSQNKYKSDFEKNKAKFTQVADDPEMVRVTRVGKQISNIEYQGRGSALSKSRKRKDYSAKTNSQPKPDADDINANDVLSGHDIITHHDDAEQVREATNEELDRPSEGAGVAQQLDDVITEEDNDQRNGIHDVEQTNGNSHLSDDDVTPVYADENQDQDVTTTYDNNNEASDVTQSYDDDTQADDITQSYDDDTKVDDVTQSYDDDTKVDDDDTKVDDATQSYDDDTQADDVTQSYDDDTNDVNQSYVDDTKVDDATQSYDDDTQADDVTQSYDDDTNDVSQSYDEVQQAEDDDTQANDNVSNQETGNGDGITSSAPEVAEEQVGSLDDFYASLG